MNFLTLHGSTAAVATGGVRQGTAIDGEGGGGWSLWPQELSLGFYVARLRGILHGSSSSSSSSMVEPPPPEAAAPPPPSGATSEAKENTRLRGRGEDKPGKGAAAGPDLGSEVDLDEALRQTKEKIKREQEEKQRREDAAAHEDRQKEEEERLRLEREAAGAAVAPAAPPVPAVEPVEPAADAEQPSSSSSLPTTTTTTTTTTSTTPGVVPLQPAGAKAVRLPITGRPPLHRPLAEVNIQKIVVTISSTDRGQRIADLWQGDKLDTIMATLTALKELCERGFDVTVWFVAAWRVSLEKERLDEASFCQRTQLPLETRYWDEFPEDIGGLLSSRHRLAMAEVLDEYDFFVSIEDDIHLEPSLIDAYLQASSRLAGAVEEEAREHHYVGFARKEHDKKHGEEWSVWETDADDYEALYVDGAGWWGYVTGNTHQAMWMATREQLYNLDDRCQDGFVRLKNPDGASWVEVRSVSSWWVARRQGLYSFTSFSFFPILFTTVLVGRPAAVRLPRVLRGPAQGHAFRRLRPALWRAQCLAHDRLEAIFAGQRGDPHHRDRGQAGGRQGIQNSPGGRRGGRRRPGAKIGTGKG